MATLTHDATTITPDLVLGYQTRHAARSSVHPILSRPDPDVTLRPALYGAGTLSLGFVDIADAQAAHAALCADPGPWAFDGTPEEATLTMTFAVAGGDVALSATGPGYMRWVVDVAYQAVQP